MQGQDPLHPSSVSTGGLGLGLDARLRLGLGLGLRKLHAGFFLINCWRASNAVAWFGRDRDMAQ